MPAMGGRNHNRAVRTNASSHNIYAPAARGLSLRRVSSSCADLNTCNNSCTGCRSPLYSLPLEAQRVYLEEQQLCLVRDLLRVELVQREWNKFVIPRNMPWSGHAHRRMSDNNGDLCHLHYPQTDNYSKDSYFQEESCPLMLPARHAEPSQFSSQENGVCGAWLSCDSTMSLLDNNVGEAAHLSRFSTGMSNAFSSHTCREHHELVPGNEIDEPDRLLPPGRGRENPICPSCPATESCYNGHLNRKIEAWLFRYPEKSGMSTVLRRAQMPLNETHGIDLPQDNSQLLSASVATRMLPIQSCDVKLQTECKTLQESRGSLAVGDEGKDDSFVVGLETSEKRGGNCKWGTETASDDQMCLDYNRENWDLGVGNSLTVDGNRRHGNGHFMGRNRSYQTGDRIHKFEDGSNEIRDESHQNGDRSRKIRDRSHQFGDGNHQNANRSHTIGDGNRQTSDGSHQAGDGICQTKDGSHQTGHSKHPTGDDNRPSGDKHSQSEDGTRPIGEGNHLAGDGNCETEDRCHQAGDGNCETGDRSHQSEYGNCETGDRSHQSEYGNCETGDRSQQAGYGNCETGDRSQQAGYGNCETGDRSQQAGYGNCETGDRSQQAGYGNRETGDRSQQAGDGNRETGDRSQQAGDGNCETGDRIDISGDRDTQASEMNANNHRIPCVSMKKKLNQDLLRLTEENFCLSAQNHQLRENIRCVRKSTVDECSKILDNIISYCQCQTNCKPETRTCRAVPCLDTERIGAGCSSGGCGGYTPSGWNRLLTLHSLECDDPCCPCRCPPCPCTCCCVDDGCGTCCCTCHVKPMPVRRRKTCNVKCDSTTADENASATHCRPSAKILGELAFQLERRILDYVFGLEGSKRRRFYGYTVSNIQQMMTKESKNYKGQDDPSRKAELDVRLAKLWLGLNKVGYNPKIHAGFAQQMINRYGLLACPPDADTVEEFGLQNAACISKMIPQLARGEHEASKFQVLLRGLQHLSLLDNGPLFVW